MTILLAIIFGIFCFAAGEYHAENKVECPSELMGYKCQAGQWTKYPLGCDHSQRYLLETKLALLPDDDVDEI